MGVEGNAVDESISRPHDVAILCATVPEEKQTPHRLTDSTAMAQTP